MECREATQQLAAYVDVPTRPQPGGEVPNPRQLEAHLLTCADCRQELIRYQELLERLAALRSHTVDPPAWLTAVLLDTARQHASRRSAGLAGELTVPRVAAAGGALLLAGLAAGTLIVGRSRRRRRRLPSALQVAAA